MEERKYAPLSLSSALLWLCRRHRRCCCCLHIHARNKARARRIFCATPRVHAPAAAVRRAAPVFHDSGKHFLPDSKLPRLPCEQLFKMAITPIPSACSLMRIKSVGNTPSEDATHTVALLSPTLASTSNYKFIHHLQYPISIRPEFVFPSNLHCGQPT